VLTTISRTASSFFIDCPFLHRSPPKHAVHPHSIGICICNEPTGVNDKIMSFTESVARLIQ
jgi:hypothetical protein